MTFQFEKLLVYQKALDFADQVCAATEQFTRGYGFLVDQLNRAALSISAKLPKATDDLQKPTASTFSLLPVARFRNAFHCSNSLEDVDWSMMLGMLN